MYKTPPGDAFKVIRMGVWSDNVVHLGWMITSMYKPIGKYCSTEDWVKKNWERRRAKEAKNGGVNQ